MGHFRYHDGEQRRLVLNTTPAQISEAPRFEGDTLPVMPLRMWETVVIAYWLPEDAAGALDETGAESGDAAATTGEAATGEAEAGERVYDANRDMVYLPPKKNTMFDRLDENDDAAISRDEAGAEPALAEAFERIDSYDNGQITRAEFALFEPADDEDEGGDDGS
jgi:hypothetical protein